MIFLFPFSFLYIPIWFYSNGNTRNDDKFNANFTFQSGSIQIHLQPYTQEHRLPLHSNLVLFKFRGLAPLNSGMLTLHSNLVLFKFRRKSICLEQHHLYLPIWFDWNDSASTAYFIIFTLYIPIWFYSNLTLIDAFF